MRMSTKQKGDKDMQKWSYTKFKIYANQNGYTWIDEDNAIKGNTRIAFNDGYPVRIVGNNHYPNRTQSNCFWL